MKEKLHPHEPSTPGAASGEPDGDGLATAEAQLNSLLAAGDAAIEAALSKDSAAFLAATQQSGGQ
jgi:hypothetical protein